MRLEIKKRQKSVGRRKDGKTEDGKTASTGPQHGWGSSLIRVDIARIPGAKLIPLGDLHSRMSELDSADTIYLQCKSGVRSANALRELQGAGFSKLFNVQGGILAWADRIDRTVAKY